MTYGPDAPGIRRWLDHWGSLRWEGGPDPQRTFCLLPRDPWAELLVLEMVGDEPFLHPEPTGEGITRGGRPREMGNNSGGGYHGHRHPTPYCIQEVFASLEQSKTKFKMTNGFLGDKLYGSFQNQTFQDQKNGFTQKKILFGYSDLEGSIMRGLAYSALYNTCEPSNTLASQWLRVASTKREPYGTQNRGQPGNQKNCCDSVGERSRR